MTTRFQHELRKIEPRHAKVMIRMDRILRERGIRAYRGYSCGRLYSQLNFDGYVIHINPFGQMWMQARWGS